MFEGDDLLAKPASEMRSAARRMQMVFQDPYSAIDPRYTLTRAVAEPFEVQGVNPKADGRRGRDVAGDGWPQSRPCQPAFRTRFPAARSNGWALPARLRCDRPSLLVLDEPTASLDVSVQAQIIGLLEDLRAELGLTYLFISHDLSLVKYFCDEILVMYLGRVVEALPDTAAPARHPYTRTLMESTFEPDPGKRRLIAPLEGEVPSPFDLPPGCAFADRCPQATDICRSETPALAAKGGHAVACHHPI
jgi:oligopeptide/dipeptide ABC transporter ATP-binding protein